MRWVVSNALAGLAIAAVSVAPALAQKKPAPSLPAPAAAARPAPAPAVAPKPYKTVAVTLPAAARDAALDNLRKELGEIAKRKDRAALASRIMPKDFFWERDFSGSFDSNKPSIDNLIAALSLDDDDRSGWESLATFAAETSAGPLPGRPTVICTPATPQIDEAARDKLIDDTQTDGIEWAYPRAAGLPVRATPDANAAVIETLGLHLIHVLGFEDKNSESDPIRTAWARVATPAGKTGFVVPGSLVSPYTDRLCFAKDAAGAWRIAGYVGGGD
jgi:hypothetical protein